MNKNKIISFITALSLILVMICPTLSVVAEGEITSESEETTETVEILETTEVMETTTTDETVETTAVEETTTVTETTMTTETETAETEESTTTTGDVETTEDSEDTTTVETAETTEEVTETTETTEVTTEIKTGIVENITVPDGMRAKIDDAVKYVPYSFTLFNSNYPIEAKEPEPEPDIPDKTVTIPDGLKLVGKGSWGNYMGDIYSDGSLMIHGIMESVGETVTIPSSVGVNPIRTIVISSYFWNGIKKMIVPDGIAFSTGSGPISYLDAIRMFDSYGITLEIQGWSDTVMKDVSIVKRGRLPEGLQFYPDTLEIYGIPLETGTFVFSIYGTILDEDGEAINTDVSFELTVKDNDNQTVFDETDEGYSILDSIGTDVGNHDYVLEELVESIYRSEGEFDEFVNIWLNGQLLVRDEDYEAESGSTKITIYAQTFETKANQQGINTIAAEFRTTDINALNTIHDTNKLHVTAQNFRLKNEDTTVNNSASGQNAGNTENTGNTGNTGNSASSSFSSSSSSSSKDAVSSTETSPSTGDRTPILLYVTIGFVSVITFTATRTSKRTKDDENI